MSRELPESPSSTPKGIAPEGRHGYNTRLTQRWEDLDALSDVRADRLAGQRDRLRDVGDGRLDRLGRRRVARRRWSGRSSSAATSSTPRGPTATGHSERLLGRLVRGHPGPDALHRDQDPAEELQVAVAPRVRARRLLPARPHPRVRREEPGEPRPARASTCCSSTSGRTTGPTTSAGSARWTT